MSEQEQTADPWENASQQNGLVRGIPGKRLVINGALDLRGVPAEKVSEIESLVINGVVLLDEQNRNALGSVASQINGTLVVADPKMNVMFQPDMEITPTMVEAMPSGQNLMIIGIIYVHPHVDPAALAGKFDHLHLVGILIARDAVVGAFMGKLEHTGFSVPLPDVAGPVVRANGQTTLDAEYLSRMEDNSLYISIGQTALPADASEELVAKKILHYVNIGQTTGPAPILALLRSRCATNMGSFEPLDG